MDIKSLIVGQATAETSGGEANLTDLTATSNGTYTHSGYDGYDEVTVAVPQPSGNINITDTNSTNVSAYATAQVVDADLVAGNIKKDVNILGVTGTYEGSSSSPLGMIFTYESPQQYQSHTYQRVDQVDVYYPTGVEYYTYPKFGGQSGNTDTSTAGSYWIMPPQMAAKTVVFHNYPTSVILSGTSAHMISNDMFRQMPRLENVQGFTIPQELWYVGSWAFQYCPKMASWIKTNILSRNYTYLDQGCFADVFTDASDINSFNLVIPETCCYINQQAFSNSTKIQKVYITHDFTSAELQAALNAGKTSNDTYQLHKNAFANTNITDIYVPWAEGAKANAPWGAYSATIHYNHTYVDGEENL